MGAVKKKGSRTRAKQRSSAQEVMAEINSAMGKPVMKVASDPDLEIIRVPTPSLVVNRITGGGLALGRHVELFGDPNCMSPGTLVLNDEYNWVELGSLSKGDGIIAFDEFPPPGRGQQRCIRFSAIKQNRQKKLECFRIKTDQGTESIASENHLWLVLGTHGRERNKPIWRTSQDLKVGDKILFFGSPWENSVDREAQYYLSGLFDGEGWCDGARVAFAQNPGLVLDKGVSMLKRLGFEITVRDSNGNGGARGKDARGVKISMNTGVFVLGGQREFMRFMAQVAPVRLMDKLESACIGRPITRKGPFMDSHMNYATVVSKKHVGSKIVCMTQTDTGTLIADGLYSHNTGKSTIMYGTMALSQCRGNLCGLIDPEGVFDADWFRHQGGYPDELLYSRPDTAEEIIGSMRLLVEKAIEGANIEIVGVDSQSAMVTKEQVEQDPNKEERVASQARMMSRALRLLTTRNRKLLFIWTNQLRSNIGFGAQFQPSVTTGGRAMSFYATTRLEFKKTGAVTESGKLAEKGELKSKQVKVGDWIQVKSQKEKTARPYQQGAYIFRSDRGHIDLASEVIHLGLEDGIIEKKGNHWIYESVDEEEYKGDLKYWNKVLAEDEELKAELIDAINDQTHELARVG